MSDPASPTRRPSLQEVIGIALDGFERRLPKALPARVTKYEASKQRVSCKVLVQRPYFDEEAARQVESIPVIPNVPVQFPGGIAFRMTFPISDGNLVVNGIRIAATTGVLIWADRSLDKWLTGGGAEVDPEFDHVHALSDAMFIPGVNPFGAPLGHVPTDKMSIGRDASPSDIEIDNIGNVTVAGGSQGAARTTDKTSADTTMLTWIAAVSALFNAAPGPMVSAPGSVVVPTDFGKITGGSTKVKIG